MHSVNDSKHEAHLIILKCELDSMIKFIYIYKEYKIQGNKRVNGTSDLLLVELEWRGYG